MHDVRPSRKKKKKKKRQRDSALLLYSLTLHDEEMWIVYIELDRME